MLKRNSPYRLIELLVVLVVLGILDKVIIPSIVTNKISYTYKDILAVIWSLNLHNSKVRIPTGQSY